MAEPLSCTDCSRLLLALSPLLVQFKVMAPSRLDVIVLVQKMSVRGYRTCKIHSLLEFMLLRSFCITNHAHGAAIQGTWSFRDGCRGNKY